MPGDSGYRGLHNVPLYARLAIPVLALFALVYFGANWITSRRAGNYHLYFDWELAFPSVPGMIYVYAVLVQRMFVPADRVIALGIYCRYCILQRRILTELVFGGHDARQTAANTD